jgi:hypothetical protein
MKYFFVFVGVCSLLAAAAFFLGANSAIERVFAALIFLNAWICFGVGALLFKGDDIQAAVMAADRHNWNLGVAHWNERRYPEVSHAMPDEEQVSYRRPYKPGNPEAKDIRDL